MATTTFQLYDALKAAGVEDHIARAAAQSVLTIEDRAHLATKADLADLRADILKAMGDLKYDLAKWGAWLLVAALTLETAVFAVIVKLF